LLVLLKKIMIFIIFVTLLVKDKHNLLLLPSFLFKYRLSKCRLSVDLTFLFNRRCGILRVQFVDYTFCQLLLSFPIKINNAIWKIKVCLFFLKQNLFLVILKLTIVCYESDRVYKKIGFCWRK